MNRSAVRHANKILSSQKRLYAANKKPTVTVFGGDVDNVLSFHVINQLNTQAHVRVQAQFPDQFKAALAKNGINENAVEIIQGKTTDEYSVETAIYGADAIVNVDQLLIEAERDYYDCYTKGVANIGTIADRYQIKKFVQTSVMGADLNHESRFLDVNYRGEDIAFGSFPDVTVVRPNFATFGDRKSIIELFRSRLPLKLSPIIPIPAQSRDLKIQPVHINDVATAITKVVLVKDMPGKIINLGGANTYVFSDFLKKVFGAKIFVPVPVGITHAIYGITQFLPGAVVTRDHVPMICQSMVEDDTILYDLTEDANLPADPNQRARFATFKDLDITPIGF